MWSGRGWRFGRGVLSWKGYKISSMASLPKSEPEPRYLTLAELEAIRGTQAFAVESGRQLQALAAHYRRTNHADLMDPDWEWLAKVWQ